VLPVAASASGLYYSATIDSRSGQVYLKIVNPGSQDVPGQLSFNGRHASAASIEVLADPDPQAGNTLANRTRWCRPAARCTAPRACSATWCRPIR
jgi:alpha-L-arabinofuranosidase